MTSLRSTSLRHVLAGVLILVLALAGAGRGLASATAGPAVGIAGVAFPICHAGGDDGSIPGPRSPHDCCDACALCAPATMADASAFGAPAAIMHAVAPAEAVGFGPTLARPRAPRQSQGPPDRVT